MNALALSQHWEFRRARMRSIEAELARFKECEQCRCIVFKRTRICPLCGCYRFQEDPEAVRGTVREMGQRPFAVTAAVVPRLRPAVEVRVPGLYVLQVAREGA